MAGMIAYTCQALDRLRHAGQGPEVRAEAKGEGTVPQGPLDSGPSRLAEFRFPPCPPGGPQRRTASAVPGPVPPHHALPADPKPARDGTIGLRASCKQPSGRKAPFLHAVEIPSRTQMCMHALMLHHTAGDVTLFYEIQ